MKRLLWCLALWPLLAGAVAVTDDTGTVISLDAPAGRIVSLAPHLTELVYAIGAERQLVGVSAYSDFPPAAQSLPQVSDHTHVDMERIQQLRPALVLAWGSGNRARDIARLRALGLPVYVSEPRVLTDVASALRDLGELSGHAPAAARVADDYLARLAALQRRYAELPPQRVFYQVSARPLITVNGMHMISQALRVCAAENVFAQLPTLAPGVALEAVLAADPDAIVVGGAAGTADLSPWQAYTRLRAVRRGALYAVPADLLHRATPRLLQGITLLCDTLRAGAVD